MMATHPALASAIVLGFALIVFWRVDRDYASRRRLSVFTAVLQVLAFLVHGLAYYSFFDSRDASASASEVIRPIAVALMVLGLTTTLGAMVQLSMGDTLGKTSRGLKKTGVYRFSRNPQLIAYFLFLTGYALLTPQWHGLGWLGLYAIVAHMMVLTEERHLRRLCRGEFDEYCRSTPRYLGWRPRTSSQ